MKILYKPLQAPGRKELDGKFFESFNWDSFNFGDVVWLEDNDETDAPAARYWGITSDQAVNLEGISYREADMIEAMKA